MTVYEKMRLIRELNKMSQEDVAERMNMSESSYSRLERGGSKLHLTRLEKFAAIFNVDICSLISSKHQNFSLSNDKNNGDNINYHTSNQDNLNLLNEIEKLKLKLKHQEQLLLAQNNEIEALKKLIDLHEKLK